jgi:methionyl-tRNA synthetase
MREVPFGSDGNFSERRFQDVVNAALANDLGNLVNRCLDLLRKNCGSTFPVSAAQAAPEEHPLRVVVAAAIPAAAAAYERLELHEAIAAALKVSSRCALGMTSR